ncbi:MAG TPA: pyridoxamine 5'-phosphate oxidase family protein [Moheibacter sp.]|nr:pyridoxamine 5'-phosphate oxidase family protein [Moheibacter sp.]
MSQDNLNHQESVEKLRQMATKIDIAMLCTQGVGTSHLHAVPMSTQEVDEEGNIWFLLSDQSESFKHLQRDSMVNLLYSDPSNYSFISIYASTEISRDKARIEKYWNVAMEGFFENGKEDAAVCLLKVKPMEAHYWDTETNKFITFFKAVVAGITGKDADMGREGDLNI